MPFRFAKLTLLKLFDFHIVPDQIFPLELIRQSVPSICLEQLLAWFRDGGQTKEVSRDTSQVLGQYVT